MSRLGTLDVKDASRLDRGLGFAGGAYKVGSRLRAISLKYTAAVAAWEPRVIFGTSSVPITLATYAEHALEIYATSPSTDGSNSAEAMYVKSVMTGAAGVGGRARFHLTTNVALGGWSNALKAHVEYGVAGRTNGLGSALCAELDLSAGTTQGNYAPLEAELIGTTSGAKTGTASAFLYCNVGGHSTAKTTINANAYFAIFGAAVTIGTKATGAIVSTRADGAATHAVKILVGSTVMWLLATTDGPED